MKTKPKLRNTVGLALVSILLVVIAAYTVLVRYSLEAVLNDTLIYEIKEAGQDFQSRLAQDSNLDLPESEHPRIYRTVEDLPDWFTQRHRVSDIQDGEVLLGEFSDPALFGGDLVFYVAHRVKLHDGGDLFLIDTYLDAEDVEIPGTWANWNRMKRISLVLGICFILFVGLVLLFFFWRVSKPINALTVWAQKLDENGTEAARPDFRFHEINQIAEFIQNASNRLQDALQREHNFLRNASHELRTPIAIIRSNIDLLKRLRPDASGKELGSYQRIRRATDSMRQLTEILLWLSRITNTMPEAEPVQIKGLIEELIDEYRFILVERAIEVDVRLDDVEVLGPRSALRIALGNLIRNAFQHASAGPIEIRLTPTEFAISNLVADSESGLNPSYDQSFKLGLLLIEQICQKLNLVYANERSSNRYHAWIRFPVQPEQRSHGPEAISM